MHYQFWIFGPLVVAAILTQADYIMDDTNTTITYVGYWSRDLHPLNFNMDPSQLLDGTATHSECNTGDGCYVTIPFVGSGINVHNVDFHFLNISFTLDGGPPSVFSYSDPGCFDKFCYDFSVFNAQSLTYGAHTLKITMFTFFPSVLPPSFSTFVFDYAVISAPSSSTSSPVSSSTSTSVIPSSTGHPMPSSHQSSKHLSAIIGGAIGGVAALVAIVLAVLCYRKRRRLARRSRMEIDPPMESSFHSATLTLNPPGQVNTTLHDDWSPSSLLPRDTNLQTNGISQLPIPPTSGKPFATAHIPISLVYPPQSQSLPQHAVTVTPPNPGSLPIGASAASPTTNTRLTEEQLVQELMRHNVPLVAVAGVMDGLLRREGASGGEGSGSRVSQSNVGLGSENPPDYDFR